MEERNVLSEGLADDDGGGGLYTRTRMAFNVLDGSMCNGVVRALYLSTEV